jgi:hypothetical protein
MPQFNHLGPEGIGPLTGRKMGNCKNQQSVDNNTRGRLHLHRHGFSSNYTIEDEKKNLENRLNNLNQIIKERNN